jgi:hypothetical protein
LRTFGPGKANDLGKLVQAKLKFEDNWSRQLKFEENWSRQS